MNDELLRVLLKHHDWDAWFAVERRCLTIRMSCKIGTRRFACQRKILLEDIENCDGIVEHEIQRIERTLEHRIEEHDEGV